MINGLPDRLKLLRAKRNLSQKEVAARLSISPSIISSYETGERTPSTENILALARLYHCTTDYLLGRNMSSSGMILDTEDLTHDQIHALQMLIEAIRAGGNGKK